ncbi:unnamed protein product [Rotaria sp. Silwood1]|nr:unnamed protein product [Rotaria sp. Silwood1]CAF1599570.1 unnamed protein product [Rotaria sp. Silwood1]CAF3463781.1 unnamed protein product [Rotaria sp. Silwood1]CAF3745015.1 unnamed protein product [Rotaria sp. Silwood1]CAF4687790.1 unnamed protein product [Rotaria sp. Silwood1]
MVLYQEFCLIWSSLELFMAISHIFVFLDAFTHLINLLLYSSKTISIPLRIIWFYALLVHLYYYRNLKTNPPPRRNPNGQKVQEDNAHKISRIFHWSCIEYEPNRFSIFESGKEMFETTVDVIAHSMGFFLTFRMIESIWYKIGALTLMFGVLYQRMIGLKFFFTEPKMMPSPLQRLFATMPARPIAD